MVNFSKIIEHRICHAMLPKFCNLLFSRIITLIIMIPGESFIDNGIVRKSTLYRLVYCKSFLYQHVKMSQLSVMYSEKGKILLVLNNFKFRKYRLLKTG